MCRSEPADEHKHLPAPSQTSSVRLSLSELQSELIHCFHLNFMCFFPVQSEDHVPEVEEAMMAQCTERLQQEACKDLFKDCTK